MERILTNAQMREADVFTIEKLGVSSEELVERAGKAVAEEINRQTEEKETYRDGKKIVTKDYILQRDWFKLKVVRNHLAKN